MLSKLMRALKWMIGTLEYLEHSCSSAGATNKVSNKPKLAKSALKLLHKLNTVNKTGNGKNYMHIQLHA